MRPASPRSSKSHACFRPYETDYTIIYVAFDWEEYGLIGSEAYVDDHPGDDIRGMLSIDMIARDAGNYAITIDGNSTALELKNAVIAAVAEYGGALSTNGSSLGGGSDHMPFASAGYQACCLIEDNYNSNPCYHEPCDSIDTADYIHYPYIMDTVRSVAGWLADAAGARPPYDCDSNGTPDADEIARRS